MILGVNLDQKGTDKKYYPLFEKAGRDKKKSIANVSIIYGTNGSGKTTLGEKLLGEEQKYAGTIGFLGKNSELMVTEDVKTHLYNERYILDNFRVDQDELGAIILLGDGVDNADQIQKLLAENEKLKVDTENLSNEHKILLGSGKGSVKKALELFKDALKEAGWQENAKLIRQQEGNISFTARKIIEIITEYEKAAPVANAGSDSGEKKFNLKMKKAELDKALEKIRRTAASAGSNRSWQHLEALENKIEESKLAKALSSVPPRVNGNEMVEAITSALSDSRLARATNQSKELIVDAQARKCPLCFHSVDDNHRDALDRALNEVYNKDRDKLEAELNRLGNQIDFPLIELDEELETILPIEAAGEYSTNVEKLRKEQQDINSLIQLKLGELETHISLDFEGFRGALESVNASIAKINGLINEHNETKENFTQVQKEALALNDLICGYSARAELTTYVEKSERAEELGGKIGEIKEKYQENDKQIDILKSQLANTTEAVNLVNTFLKVIFVEENRLKLEPAKNGYAVSCNGSRLKPNDLSTGERNILSLAYFFVDIFESIADFNEPTDHRLIVLDDPLSSFDEDNRYGVLIFLQQIINRISAQGANRGGQVVFLTHDARLVFNLNDAFKTASNVSVVNHKMNGHKLEPNLLEKSNKYSTALTRVVNYALLGTDHSPVRKLRPKDTGSYQSLVETDIAIIEANEIPSGNEVRQVLEAYSEFNFGKDISALMQDSNVEALLKEEGEDFSRYLRGSLYKLILHGESHTQDAVKAGDYEFSALAKSEDRLGLCREMICLISVLTREHVASRLNLKESGKGLSPVELNEYIQDWGKAMEDRVIPIIQV